MKRMKRFKDSKIIEKNNDTKYAPQNGELSSKI